MNFQYLVETYGGWFALAIYFLYNKVWPLVSDRLVPSKIEEAKQEQEFRHSLFIRQADASDRVAEAVQTIAISMTQTNERIATIMNNQALILSKQELTQSTLTGAIADFKGYIGTADRRKKEEERTNATK